MHAVAVDATFKDDLSGVKAELDQLVPRVSAAPGFVAAYWIAVAPGKGTSVVVFESEEAAQALLQTIQSGPPPTSVTTDRVEVGEVLAHASTRSGGDRCRVDGKDWMIARWANATPQHLRYRGPRADGRGAG